MVRKYVRKTERGSVSEETMKAAVLEVKRNSKSVRGAALEFNIPRKTLERYCKKFKDLSPAILPGDGPIVGDITQLSTPIENDEVENPHAAATNDKESQENAPVTTLSVSSSATERPTSESRHWDRFGYAARFQTLVALGPLVLTICSGMTVGYSAILLPQLEALKNTTIIDSEEASWIASMAAFPMAIGSIFGGIFSAKLGRKTTHSISCLPTFLGWLLIYLAEGTKMILIGRFITGFTTGMLASATGVYIGETSEPTYRGFLLAGISFSISLGLFLSHLLGTFLTWQNTALICSLLPLLSQLIMFCTPESPSWLASKGKLEEAEHSFYWCRGTTEEAKKEFDIMRERYNQHSKEEAKNFREKLDDILVPEFLKPLCIITVYITANQWAGINAITFYSVSIMKDTIGGGINEYMATIIVDIMRLFMSTLACFLLRTVARRPLALISGIGTFISLLTLSIYTYLVRVYPQMSLGYLPLLCLVCYIIFITVGFVPLPWAMMGELYPVRHRSVGSGFSAVMAFLAFFSVVKFVPSMFENYGTYGTFFTFSVVAFIGTVFIYFFLPETKGRPLHEIEDSFKSKK